MAPTPPMRTGDTVGLWGAPTSTLNWCETNYESSYYIAEFWNTITNLSMIIPSIYGMIHCRRQGIEPRYTYSFLTLLFIGIGSWMFHMTLRFEMQLLDELPMLFGSSYVVYCLYAARYSWKDGGYILGILLTLNCVIVTVVYLLYKEPIFFQIMFAIIVAMGLIVSLHHIYNQYSTLSIKFLALVSVISSIAFFLWNIDNTFCPQLTNMRVKILRPNLLLKYLSPLTQLHGWWHLLSGYAYYLQVFACVHQRLLFLNIEHSADERWNGLIRKIDVTEANQMCKSGQYKD